TWRKSSQSNGFCSTSRSRTASSAGASSATLNESSGRSWPAVSSLRIPITGTPSRSASSSLKRPTPDRKLSRWCLTTSKTIAPEPRLVARGAADPPPDLARRPAVPGRLRALPGDLARPPPRLGAPLLDRGEPPQRPAPPRGLRAAANAGRALGHPPARGALPGGRRLRRHRLRVPPAAGRGDRRLRLLHGAAEAERLGQQRLHRLRARPPDPRPGAGRAAPARVLRLRQARDRPAVPRHPAPRLPGRGAPAGRALLPDQPRPARECRRDPSRGG